MKSEMFLHVVTSFMTMYDCRETRAFRTASVFRVQELGLNTRRHVPVKKMGQLHRQVVKKFGQLESRNRRRDDRSFSEPI